jgi:hypothetical protein
MSEFLELVEHLRETETRVKRLEEVNRWVLDSLDLAASLGDFHSRINDEQDDAAILAAARAHLNRLFAFRAIAFFTVDDADFDFTMIDCEPKADSALLQQEVDLQIGEGTFAWARQGTTGTRLFSMRLRPARRSWGCSWGSFRRRRFR